MKERLVFYHTSYVLFFHEFKLEISMFYEKK